MDLGPSFYTREEYTDCLNILFKVNKLLGFFNSTVRLLKIFPQDISVVDVGCGGGLFLLHLNHYFPNMTLLGIDVSETAIESAQNALTQSKKDNIQFLLQKQQALDLSKDSVDIVLITLVCHHVDDEDLPAFLQNAWQAARKAVIIHDLHRHALAYWFYKKISPILFHNRLITHDGLVSIRRSFTRADLHNLMKQTNIPHYEIKWGFPFQWRIILWKN